MQDNYENWENYVIVNQNQPTKKINEHKFVIERVNFKECYGLVKE